MELSLAGARALHLGAQGLLAPGCGPAGKANVLAAIRRMGALQIDAINVVARSQYLVLWSRLGRYDAAWLDELLAEGCLFEYWAHAACFLPIEEYALFRHRMSDGEGWAHTWLAEHAEVAERVLAHVRERGGARAADFARADGRSGGWWDWKPEKIALEALHTAGDLMIARREGFQRVYDLRERVLPGWDDGAAPSAAAARRALALRAVRALGVAPARWVPDYYRLPKRQIAALLAELADEGVLTRARVAGWDEPAYLHPDNAALAEAARAGAPAPARTTTLLSPFDPLVWDRARAEELFGFAYRIEVYTPAARRRYGYYTLPILHGDRLVGRVDPKVERKEGRLVARAVHLEPGVAPDEALVGGLARALRDLADFLTVPEVVVERSDPASLAPTLRARLAGEASHCVAGAAAG
ncbi:MAG TPA: crosslink repair DNA glycosylase YcaQ family protein [Thermomicrobiales bacterium]|nr:crosslink repair DNA glycosylase YcaQ family protein [Thermomicrobiales bacterium]